MWRFRFSLILAVLLAWASVPMAVARASMAGSITICTGDGVQTISLDANGQPVVTVDCPDCSLAAAALLPAPAVQGGTFAVGQRVSRPSGVILPVPFERLHPSARGPPALV